jgi:hypothetical protein
MRAMLPSKATKSRVTSSRKWRHSSRRFCFSEVSEDEEESSGGGVAVWVLEMTRDSGLRMRLEMRLKGFSSTFRRRDL